MTQTTQFDVVGAGYISEHHADDQYRHRLAVDHKATGGAVAWLLFYTIAIVVVALSNTQNTATTVLAAIN